jgi:hypothetical protein
MDCASCKTAAGREYVFADGEKGLDYVRMDTLAAGTTARHLGCTADSSNVVYLNVVYLVEWQFHMNAKGSAKTFRNVMTGSSTGLHVSLFDYSYVVSDGRNSRTCAQTVASFSKTGVQLPEFQIGPKELLQKFGDALFHTNINFDSRADFSRRYQIRSPTQEKTRELFTGSLLSFLEGLDAKQEWRLEGSEETLIVYRAGKRVKPEDLRVFLDETARLASSFLSLGNCKRLAA